MSNPIKINIGAVGTFAFGPGEAMLCGTFRMPHVYLRDGHPSQLTKEELAKLLAEAMDSALVSYQKELDEQRTGANLILADLPYGCKDR